MLSLKGICGILCHLFAFLAGTYKVMSSMRRSSWDSIRHQFPAPTSFNQSTAALMSFNHLKPAARSLIKRVLHLHHFNQ